MAELDFALFVTALVHYRENSSARLNVQTVATITGLKMSRRVYWHNLSLVHHFVAGLTLELAEVVQ